MEGFFLSTNTSHPKLNNLGCRNKRTSSKIVCLAFQAQNRLAVVRKRDYLEKED